MNTELRPYEEYEETGESWLDKIPRHWKAVKTKYLFTERSQKGFPNEPLLAATQTKGVVPKALYENRTVLAQKDLHLLKLVKKGDFVISLRSFQGGIEYAYFQGIISPAYTILNPSKLIHSPYYRLLFKSCDYVNNLKTHVTGIREGQNIDYARLKRSLLPLPPVEEQTSIARFLDQESRKINRFIQNKKKLISLLNEQKQAIINQAVTKGLNPDARMKPSGVEWLGEIPEDWTFKYAGQIFREKKEKNLGMKEKTVLSLSYGKIVIKPEEKLHGLVPASFETYQIVRPDDLIIRSTDLQNDQKSLRIGHVKNVGIITSAYICLKLIDFLEPQFAYLLLHSYDLRKIFYSLGSGLRQNLRFEDMKRLPILVPPVKEQNTIVNEIEKLSENFDKSIRRMDGQISLIQEYRTRLISDVVTGKLDVRGIAPLDSDIKEDELAHMDEIYDAGEEEDGMEEAGPEETDEMEEAWDE